MPSVDLDALASSMACCDLDLQNVIRSPVGANKCLSFIEIVQASQEISW